MNVTEWKTHFAAWCITSSPLMLGMDVTDQVSLDLVWPILTNRDAIEVNQIWVGDSGRLNSQSTEQTRLPNCGSGSGCYHPSWMVWSKMLPPRDGAHGTRAAVLLMNNGNSTTTLSVDLTSVHGLGACQGNYSVSDVWQGSIRNATTILSSELEPHASDFFVASCNTPLPPAPTPSPGPTCLQDNVLFDSHKTGNTKLVSNYKSAKDGLECQQICHATDGCKCFTHRKSTGHCWLMSSCQISETDSRYVSGPATCPAADQHSVV